MQPPTTVEVFRTVAFFLVVACHFGGAYADAFAHISVAHGVLEWFAMAGPAGTDAFFLLSAFLLSRSLTRGSPWLDAVRRRLLRFYPGFLIMLGAYVLAAQFVPQLTRFPREPLEAVLYVLANALLLPGIFPVTPLMTVAWSLSYVVFGYLMVGALHRVTRSQVSLVGRCAVWIGAGLLIWIAARYWGLPHLRLASIPLGGLVAELAPYFQKTGWPRWAIAAGACATLATVFGPGRFLAVAVLGLMVLSSDATIPGLTGFVFSRLSRLSYPVFLTHGAVLHGIRWLGPVTENGVEFVALFVAMAALVIAAAAIFQHWVLDVALAYWRVRGTTSFRPRENPTPS